MGLIQLWVDDPTLPNAPPDKLFNNAELSDVEVFSLALHGESLPLNDHFTLGELRCNDGSDIVLVHPYLVALLESIRLEIGSPLRLTNAYRSHQHNIAVGGAPRSKHLYGMAADVYANGIEPIVLANIADSLDAGGIFIYDTFCHVDVYGFGRRG